MANPEYQPAAQILPGNISYREPSPPASDDGQDDSSDLDLDDAEYALKISEELGLGQITDVEKFASLPVLWPHPRNPKEAKEMQNKVMVQLQAKLHQLTRGDRFRATNLYAPPGSTATPQYGTGVPVIGASLHPIPSEEPVPTGLPAAASMPSNGMAWPIAGLRHYALPPEPPVDCVPANADTAERVDRLLAGAIEDMRAQAEKARGEVLGGQLDDD